ncbi:hypothetical protein [Paraburkholderia domus]|jgi:hypothetical protein|uniref:hypothetical protein n=1 Tax=Paraburkholderia domus TaxID=2793075 RepID=UPI001914AC64|nr:hypothetical protein [Paraburkholderia domus]MBK5186113.1 hypothetical protein [Burkholderia sp. R-69749]MCI0150212.1 hypothetical protein [Paraburkholderia sediminicola]CAE6900286.1 hypothetical protein R69749_08109 [Paraburkholderia domus]
MPLLNDAAMNNFRQLCQVQFAEGLRALSEQIGRINADCAAKGVYNSGARLLLLERAFAAELGNRATLIWRNLVRVHQTYGADNAGGAVGEFKAIFERVLGESFTELGRMLRDEQARGGATRTSTTAFEAEMPHLVQKHAVEINLYCEDSARSATAGERKASHSYNFYGTVGSVQTGASATSNVVQTIGGEDKERLKNALREVQKEMSASGTLDATRDDLTQVLEESIAELDKPKANGMKLTSLLTTVGNTVQTLAAAPQAYQVLKTALVPFGIMLP